MPLIYFKGFQALQLYRISHWLWNNKRYSFALFLQNNISERFAVDIHPAAKLGDGIMIDHATGLVIGETAVVGNDVSILHSVTLGGSGCHQGIDTLKLVMAYCLPLEPRFWVISLWVRV